TGHDKGDGTVAVGTGPDDHPAIGSVLGMVRPPRVPVPPFVSMPFITKEGAGGPPQPGFFGGLLGRARDPLFVLRDPNAAGFGMPERELPAGLSHARLGDRQKLLGRMGGAPGAERRAGELTSFQTRAFDLLASPATQQAFHLEREPSAVRDAYG